MTEKALSKALKSLIIIGSVFVFMLISWIVIANTPLIDIIMGTNETVTAPELVEGEALGPNNRILMFEHVDRSRISSIEIHNPDGEYTFVNNKGSFGLPQYEGMYYDEQSMASLIVTAGYTITQERVTKDAKKEDRVRPTPLPRCLPLRCSWRTRATPKRAGCSTMPSAGRWTREGPLPTSVAH